MVYKDSVKYFYNLLTLLIYSLILFSEVSAGIKFADQSATVWLQQQTIKGYIDSSSTSTKGILYFNGTQLNFTIDQNDSFSVQVNLHNGINSFVASTDSNGTVIYSDTLKYTLGFKLKPILFSYSEVNNSNVILHCNVVDNPDSSSLSFQWTPDPANPSTVSISNNSDSVVSINFNGIFVPGEYYFNVIAFSPNGDTSKARTFITVDSSGYHPFNIKQDYAKWIDKAVIYEITPYIFVNGKSDFNQITKKIPELATLGVNVIWLQPIYKTYGGGQGYDVTDYFGIRSDLGTEQDLRKLIHTAKSFNMKVLFDFVANHTSIHHPYAVNSTKFGKDSHYYDYYQRERDNKPYSGNYHEYQGFINYFWNDLPNLNYDNPEVQRWIIEAAKYWIEKFDIDGYRFDAIWGVNARKPDFTKRLRIALKSIKPEILMLAEDKASQSMVFDERFDAAYDWAPEESWVSHWVWQTNYSTTSNPTIFNNSNEDTRTSLLRNSLTNNGKGYSPKSKILRFIENNDTYRFITHHGLERTKMAAGLIFSLNGIPLVYNGQEVGANEHPTETEYIYYPGTSIKSFDKYGLFDYYKRLIFLKENLSALDNGAFEETSISPNNYTYAFRRFNNNQNVFSVINMGQNSTPVTLSVPVDRINLDSLKTYYLTDVLSGEVLQGNKQYFRSVNLTIPGYTTRIFLLADSMMTVTSVNTNLTDERVPQTFSLGQNYPNPFNPVTTITYSVPTSSQNLNSVTLKVFDILGREVATLVNETQQPGSYKVQFDASSLSSGVYFYRLDAGSFTSTKKMILLR